MIVTFELETPEELEKYAKYKKIMKAVEGSQIMFANKKNFLEKVDEIIRDQENNNN